MTAKTRAKKPGPGQKNKDALLLILCALVPRAAVETEHRFHPVRMWRFDYAIPALKIAVEYHGHAGFVGGKASGHSTIKGLANDCEKANAAITLGWKVLAFTALHFDAGKRAKHKLLPPAEVLRAAVPPDATLLGIHHQPELL